MALEEIQKKNNVLPPQFQWCACETPQTAQKAVCTNCGGDLTRRLRLS